MTQEKIIQILEDKFKVFIEDFDFRNQITEAAHEIMSSFITVYRGKNDTTEEIYKQLTEGNVIPNDNLVKLVNMTVQAVASQSKEDLARLLISNPLASLLLSSRDGFKVIPNTVLLKQLHALSLNTSEEGENITFSIIIDDYGKLYIRVGSGTLEEFQAKLHDKV